MLGAECAITPYPTKKTMSNHTTPGLFWDQAIEANPKRMQRAKPKPFWLDPSYLPGLSDARVMTGVTRMLASDWGKSCNKDWIVFDTECYPNRFAVGFKNVSTGKVDWIEKKTGETFDAQKCKWILQNHVMVGFNSDKYDMMMLSLAMAGLDCSVLKKASDDMIVRNVPAWMVLKEHKVWKFRIDDHIDLREIAPGFHSLKTYGARLNTRRMQDLPFHPDTVLSDDQWDIVRYYMCNDLDLTEELYNKLKEQIDLRTAMSNEYGVNLLSKSDAQIAETVIRTMYERETGQPATPPTIEYGTAFKYNVPAYLKFQSKTMRDVLELIRRTEFKVGYDGKIGLPSELSNFQIRIGDALYTLGIGGLHSNESNISYFAKDGYSLRDADVGSFYPRIILNQGLYPEHLGPSFLKVYGSIVDRRLLAKENGDKIIAESLKIVINSSFGKFGNQFSVLFSPQFLIQVTISGQLSLLMLIDALESVGIKVVSANTDGIVVYAHESQIELRDRIFDWWQKACDFKLEFTDYRSIHSASVNSYYAIKYNKKDEKWEAKRKGLYAPYSLSTTPSANVCADAVEAFLVYGTPIAEYIQQCNNPHDFGIVRNVSGGGVWRDEYLGKVVRFYIGSGYEPVVYAKSGAKVPQSEGARPMMELPKGLPKDLNEAWYIAKAKSILQDIGINTAYEYA